MEGYKKKLPGFLVALCLKMKKEGWELRVAACLGSGFLSEKLGGGTGSLGQNSPQEVRFESPKPENLVENCDRGIWPLGMQLVKQQNQGAS